MALPDLLEPNLKVVFCGTAAGDRSALAKAYYASPGNSFWSTLAQIRLTHRRLDPQEFRILLRYGIGLTDLAKGFHGSDRRTHSSNFDVESFRLKMEKFKPKTVAFNGKRAARIFLRQDSHYGLQTWTIGKSAIFVLPSTSGAARRYWDLSHWIALSDFLQNASTRQEENTARSNVY